MITFCGIGYKQVKLDNDSVHNYADKIRDVAGKKLGYVTKTNIAYYSERYDQWVLVSAGTRLDGATQAKDIDSFSWLFHDILCATGEFAEGDKCNNWQASMILHDILLAEGRWFRAKTWFVGTWLFGGGQARKNGMI